MTVSSTINRNDYTGDGIQTVYAFTFRVYDDSDLTVIVLDADGVTEHTLTLNVDYEVSISGTGGNITFIGSYADDPPSTKITIIRILEYTQQIGLSNVGNFPKESIEEMADRAVMLVQQLIEVIGRSVQLPVSSAYSNLKLPDPVALRFLRWNAAATALENMDIAAMEGLAISDFGKTLVAAVTADAVLTTLGISTFIKTLLDDADASAALSTLGVSTFIKTLLDDADAAAARTTLGITNKIVDVWEAEITDLVTGTGTIPNDDTIPQITEGFDLGFALKFTPHNAANIIEILLSIPAGYYVNTAYGSLAVFKDSVANAVSAKGFNVLAGTVLIGKFVAGGTSEITLTARAGANSSDTWYFNTIYNNSTRGYGGVQKLYFKVTERTPP